MWRITIRVLFAVALLGIGWGIGRAQQLLADFELVIDAPEGETTVTCVRGCQGLAWIERTVPGSASPSNETVFTYRCSNSQNARCGSGRIGGWLRR